MFIDTHTHLNNEQFIGSEAIAIKKAKDAGVDLFFVVGWDIASSLAAVKLAEQYEEVYAIVGVHPTDALQLELTDLKEIEKLLTHPKVIAYGEIGLDYYWVKDEVGQAKQQVFLAAQIELANKYNLPVTIHMRDATNDTYKILKEHRPLAGGVMHCYSGSKEMVQPFLDLGMYISLGGPVTFKNARVPKEVAEIVPLDKLLIETDAPYLAPHPYRGKQNEPALLPLVAEEIARIRNMKIEEVGRVTSRNAKALFRVEQND